SDLAFAFFLGLSESTRSVDRISTGGGRARNKCSTVAVERSGTATVPLCPNSRNLHGRPILACMARPTEWRRSFNANAFTQPDDHLDLLSVQPGDRKRVV